MSRTRGRKSGLRGGAEQWSIASVPTVVERSSFPQYAYGVLQAASLAKTLGVQRITVAELGVAGGNGLLELERLSKTIAAEKQVDIKSVGFDLGCGMPQPVD